MIKVVIVNLQNENRIESGPICFVNKDGVKNWNGLFLRGDDSFFLAIAIEKLLNDVGYKKDCNIPIESLIYVNFLKEICRQITEEVVEK
jgi:hypothetical protein